MKNKFSGCFQTYLNETLLNNNLKFSRNALLLTLAFSMSRWQVPIDQNRRKKNKNLSR